MSLKKLDTSKLNLVEKQILDDFTERRRLFDTHLKNTNVKLFTCPSCGYPTIEDRGRNDICSVCWWEDDGQDNEDADEVWGGPNHSLSLKESRLRIGKKLNSLAKKLHGTINLIPEEVLQILKDRDNKIHMFSVSRITSNTDISDPAWKEWRELHKTTLAELIK